MSPADPDPRRAYREMLRVARRVTLSEDEAHDLVQDAIIVALERGREDWSSPRHRAWLHGVLRKRSAFLARTGERRRRRERLAPIDVAERKPWAWQSEFLSALPPSLRTLACLARADLSAEEIRCLLDLSPTAFRTRLSALSRRVRGEELLPVDELSSHPQPLGPRRAAVLKQLKKLPQRTLATHDPDGHVIFFRAAAHKSGAGGN